MKLFIQLDDKILDTSAETVFALNMSYQYLEDPSTIPGDYSKSINIPGTAHNNTIFGHYWNLDRSIQVSEGYYTGAYFNASKKVPCNILIDNDIYKKGYVQLNSINNDRGKITYEITFYSNVCNVLSSLLDKSIKELTFPNNLAHIINLRSIEDNIKGEGPILAGTSGQNAVYLSDYVSYGFTNDGVYENFKADKWVTVKDGKLVLGDVDNYGTQYDSSMILEAASNRLRPFLKVAPLLDRIRRDFNETSDVKLSYNDPYFFNSNNPYISSGVLSLKEYDTSTDRQQVNKSSIKNVVASVKKIGDTFDIPLKGEFANSLGKLDVSPYTILPDLTVEFMMAVSFKLDNNAYQNAIKEATKSFGRQFKSVLNFQLNLYLEDEAGNKSYMFQDPIYPSESELHSSSAIILHRILDKRGTLITPYLFERDINKPVIEVAWTNDVYYQSRITRVCSLTECHDAEVHIYQPRYWNLDTKTFLTSDVQEWNFLADDVGVSDFFPVRFHITNLKGGVYKLGAQVTAIPKSFNIVNINDDWNMGSTSINIPLEYATVSIRGDKVDAQPAANNVFFIPRNEQPLKAFIANSLNKTYVVSTTGTPITFSTNVGTVPGSTVTFSDMIDTETTQGSVLINYAKCFNMIFDSDNDDVIELKTRSQYHSSYKIHDWTSKVDWSKGIKKVPNTFSNRFFLLKYNDSESYYADQYNKIYDDPYGIQKIDTGWEFNNDSTDLISDQLYNQTIMVANEGRIKVPVPGYFTKDNFSRSPIDGHYSLLFDSKEYKQNLYVFDDDDVMYDSETDSDMCWVDYGTIEAQGKSFPGKHLQVPIMSSLIKTSNGTFSYDLGYPQSNYAGWSMQDYPSSGTIYNNYWDDYIKDLYDKDTSIITVYIRLSLQEMKAFTFKDFVLIKDTLWHPNKVIDYNPLSTAPVRFEMIKVGNVKDYTESQLKWQEYNEVIFNVYSVNAATKASELLSPNADGIIYKTTDNSFIGKFLRGNEWSQGFSYVSPYNSIANVEVYYYDEDGNKVIANEWFDVNTLTLTPVKGVVYNNLTVNLKVEDSTAIWHNVSYEVTNATILPVIPDKITGRIEDNSKLEFIIKPNDLNMKLMSLKVTSNGTDITSAVTSMDNIGVRVSIESVTGDIITTASYGLFEDEIVSWVSSNSVINTGLILKGNNNESLEAIVSGGSSTEKVLQWSSKGYVESSNGYVRIADGVNGMSYIATKSKRVQIYDPCTYSLQRYGNTYMNKEASVINNGIAIRSMGEFTGETLKVLGGGSKVYYIEHKIGDDTNVRWIPVMHYYDGRGYKPALKEIRKDGTVKFYECTSSSINSREDIYVSSLRIDKYTFFQSSIQTNKNLGFEVLYKSDNTGALISSVGQLEYESNLYSSKIEITNNYYGTVYTFGSYVSGSRLDDLEVNIDKNREGWNRATMRISNSGLNAWLNGSRNINENAIYNAPTELLWICKDSMEADIKEIICFYDNMFNRSVLVPVLRYTGTSKVYGDAPTGYEPMFKDLVKDSYLIPSSGTLQFNLVDF